MKVYNKIITEIISKDLVDYIVIKPEYQNNNLVVATITSLGFIPIIANGDKYRFISAETKNLATTLHNSY
jgi:tyrosine-protein phosphatase YwqE